MNCLSCEMPLKEEKDFGGQDITNKYCVHCTDEQGNLKTRQEIREGMINFFMKSQNKDKEKAEKFVDEYMKKMPAWK